MASAASTSASVIRQQIFFIANIDRPRFKLHSSGVVRSKPRPKLLNINIMSFAGMRLNPVVSASVSVNSAVQSHKRRNRWQVFASCLSPQCLGKFSQSGAKCANPRFLNNLGPKHGSIYANKMTILVQVDNSVSSSVNGTCRSVTTFQQLPLSHWINPREHIIPARIHNRHNHRFSGTDV